MTNSNSGMDKDRAALRLRGYRAPLALEAHKRLAIALEEATPKGVETLTWDNYGDAEKYHLLRRAILAEAAAFPSPVERSEDGSSESPPTNPER